MSSISPATQEKLRIEDSSSVYFFFLRDFISKKTLFWK